MAPPAGAADRCDGSAAAATGAAATAGAAADARGGEDCYRFQRPAGPAGWSLEHVVGCARGCTRLRASPLTPAPRPPRSRSRRRGVTCVPTPPPPPPHPRAQAYMGMGLRSWGAFLWRHAGEVDWRLYWRRVAAVTAVNALSDAAAALDWALHARAAAAQRLHPEPLFVLGTYRSGTTLLQNLIVRCDPAYAYLDVLAAACPRGFLSTTHARGPLPRALRRLVGGRLPATRAQDNVAMGADAPAEDEMALFNLGLPVTMMGVVLPRGAAAVAAAGPRATAAWLGLGPAPAHAARMEAALLRVWRKLTLCDARRRGGRGRGGAAAPRPLALKSPMLTGNVDMLLRLFPRAKFVHIEREPLALFQVRLGVCARVLAGGRADRGSMSSCCARAASATATHTAHRPPPRPPPRRVSSRARRPPTSSARSTCCRRRPATARARG